MAGGFRKPRTAQRLNQKDGLPRGTSSERKWGASFGPEALRAIESAFDAAWADFARNFGNDPTKIEIARLKLANAMLSVADEDSRDVSALKQAALERMALEYRS
jgi:hypothetical protein